MAKNKTVESPRYGATIMFSISGNGVPPSDEINEITFSCELDTDTQFKCPFAVGEITPLTKGKRCILCEGFECMSWKAREAALDFARAALEKCQEEIDTTE